MTITDITGLFVATNIKEDFTILIGAADENEATTIAMQYFEDAGMAISLEDLQVRSFDDTDIVFDCDYLVLA